MANEMEGARREQAAILFADVHAFTVHMARNEAETFARVMQARILCRRLIGDYGGRVVQTVGDGIFAVFAVPDQAVRFALAFQRDMADDLIWHDQPLRFRIGIHAGEVVFVGDDLYGLAINIAERLQGLAVPGGICVSEAARVALEEAGDLAWRTLGYRRLHNVQEAMLVHEIELGGVSTKAPVEPIPLSPALPLPAELTAGGEATLAVLPLTPLSGEPTDQHLARGISADVIHNLTRFREILVIARNSAFRFKGELDDQATAQRLGVRYLFKGTLQRHERRLRVTGQLIDAGSGLTLWADHFDGVLGDIFLFQDEITSIIAGRLAIQIAAAERRRRQSSVPVLSAYGLVLRGEELTLDLRRETIIHARRLFEQATAVDPHYGRSYAALSRTFNYDWRYGWSAQPEQALDQALDLARAAVRADALDARGFAELGFAHLYRKDRDAALGAYDRAIELNPNDADILAEYADALVYDGQPERAVQLVQRAMRLNPYFPDWYLWNLAGAYGDLRQNEDVIATVHRMRNPSEGRRLLAGSYAHLGREEEARQQAAEIMRLHPGFTISAWRDRQPYRDRATLDYFIEGLRRAGLPE